jgi:mannose-6-phosphate isomerase-like protein (cupin superfamily)
VTVFVKRKLSSLADVKAPDGSDVRLLASSKRGSMAHFSLAPGQVSEAVVHKTVEELWYVIAGQGQIWRKHYAHVEVTELEHSLSLSIPVDTHFQFRCTSEQALEIVAVTMPPWPGEDEAQLVEGYW